MLKANRAESTQRVMYQMHKQKEQRNPSWV